MAKMTISESRLHELIQESIYEVLQEAQYDEGIGHFLGNLWQSAKNKWNNFKGDFNAGRNKARYDNRDYDAFSYYGDEADNFRNFGGQEYGAHRYNTTVDRNAGAKQWTRQRYGDEGMPYPNQGGGSTTTPPQSPQGQTTPSSTQVQGHPDLGGGQQTPQSTSAAPQGNAQTTTQQSTTQPQNTTQQSQNPIGNSDHTNDTMAQKKQLERTLKQLGLQPIFDKDSNGNKTARIVGWKGPRTQEIRNIIGDWSGLCGYPTLKEQKRQLTHLINEVNALQNKINNRKRKK